MSVIVDKLFNHDSNHIVLSTFQREFRAGDLKENVRYYEDILSEKVTKGMRIGVLLPKITDYLSLVLAINKLGAIVVPLSWQFRTSDLTTVLEHANPHIIFTIKTYNDFSFDEVCHEWARHSNEITEVFVLDEQNNWENFCYGLKKKAVEEEDMAFICFTSGSTGVPKGIVIKDEAFDFSFEVLTDFYQMKPSDQLFLNAPPTSYFGVAALLTGVYNGSTVSFPESFDYSAIVQLMERNHCNKVMSTPSIFKAINHIAQSLNKDVLDHLELVGLTGEKVTSSYRDEVYLHKDCQLITMYGSSETGGVMLCEISEELVFTVYKDIDYKVKDGELVVKSPGQFSHYYNNPSLTDDIIDSNGWVYTGDFVHEKGARKVEIVGRKKDMIKKGGQQVIPSEVEEVLLSHESVEQAVVLGIEHQVLGEEIVAFVVVNNTIEQKELASYCARFIAQYKVPDQVIQVYEIPISQGKVDKLRLKQMV
ncbi:hypothetical protein J416_05983 [Gracilibacillus halophilus YIM-C55.5]|uniref:AMP-dependent synthetase and ligase n=1 Tax=Gracilibacillus halophilus YIM-C55.5 TaxID=1308866 RepID=N4WN33_9BACI|nr:class I adenylate-forming enzyme family protein [Gracilibacillus halophilus]ENH97537.1 hypothetical protein J416_05983 [Gracilibacillus halophilus YIM-C55.5]